PQTAIARFLTLRDGPGSSCPATRSRSRRVERSFIVHLPSPTRVDGVGEAKESIPIPDVILGVHVQLAVDLRPTWGPANSVLARIPGGAGFSRPGSGCRREHSSAPLTPSPPGAADANLEKRWHYLPRCIEQRGLPARTSGDASVGPRRGR